MLTMEDMPLQTEHQHKYWMSSIAIVQKIAVQRVAHAVNMICTTRLCVENFVV